MATVRLAFHPLTPERWSDFEALFGPRGACGGCWCMLWRLTRSEFERQKGAGNKRAMRRLVRSGKPPGILAYAGAEPVGWCAVAPRGDYPSLERSRVLKRIDDTPVWSVACLFVKKEYRKQGVSVALLEAVIAHVRRQGGRCVEGYPVEPKKPRMPDVFAWTGLASAFERAGFEECARGSATRPIVRYAIRGPRRRP
ncbi:MAG: GNAT family N-acetyltransferase [Myxococcota bacterium]|nr:GNAT family N-acetyltransferase [Myxococcota bacterium]